MIFPITRKNKEKFKENKALLANSTKDPYIPSEQFLLLFKEEWTNYFRRFDDAIIPIVQYFHFKRRDKNRVLNKIVGFFLMICAYILTFFTQIEYGPSLCVFFITTGNDYIGNWMLIIAIITALSAQFPKRFLFRKRPFMDKRALQIGKDKTSSFPSRSAVCGIVYSFAAVTAYNYHYGVVNNSPEEQFQVYQMVFIVLMGGLLASVGRIYLGVHYPSDCASGMAMGLGICALSYLTSIIPNVFGCPSCYNQGCYPTTRKTIMTNENFGPQNIQLAFLVIVVIGVLQIFSNWPPLKFWDKSAPIFGYKYLRTISLFAERTFSACMAAEIMMVCPKNRSKGLTYDHKIDNSGYVYILILTQANLLLAVLTTKIYRRLKKMSWNKAMMWNIIVYLLFALVFLILIIVVRLGVMFPDINAVNQTEERI